MKLLNIGDRIHNRVFDAIVAEINDAEKAKDLNQLSAVIFDFVKQTNLVKE